MGAIDGVPLLLAAAAVIARNIEERISETIKLIDEQGGQTVFVNSLRVSTVQIELAVVGIFSLFEARMQRHIPQGSFFRQLQKRLSTDDHSDLADRVYQYFLAVNVLKHGLGNSYNELLEIPSLPFCVKKPEDNYFYEGDVAEPEGLKDVGADGFFTDLIETLEQVYFILEGR